MSIAAPPPPRGSRLDTLRPLPVVLRGWRAWYALTIAWNAVFHLAGAAAAAGAAWAVSLAVTHAVSSPAHGAGDPRTAALLWAPTLLVLGMTLLRAIAQ